MCIQVEQNRNEAYLKHTCSISIRNEKLMTKQTTYHNVFWVKNNYMYKAGIKIYNNNSFSYPFSEPFSSKTN